MEFGILNGMFGAMAEWLADVLAGSIHTWNKKLYDLQIGVTGAHGSILKKSGLRIRSQPIEKSNFLRRILLQKVFLKKM